MSWKSFPCHHCCGPCRGSTHHCNRQDAREGGETPPLPRNCERTCFPSPSFIEAKEPNRVSARVFPHMRNSHQATEVESTRFDFGKAAESSASQETGPRRTQPLSRSEGNEGAIMPISIFLRSTSRRAHPSTSRSRARFSPPFFSRSAPQSAQPHPFAASSPMPPAPEVTGAAVSLVSNGQVIASAVSVVRWQLPDHHRLCRPLLSRRLGQIFPPTANARFLRRPV